MSDCRIRHKDAEGHAKSIRLSREAAIVQALHLERRSKSFGERHEWRDVEMIVARMSGRPVDTATQMAIDADFSEPAARSWPLIEPRKVDPIDELKRLIGQGPED